jgi:hypothetical protein
MQMNEPHFERDDRPDRRRHARYVVQGSLLLETEQRRYEAVPVDLGLGGVLFTAENLPPLHTKARMQLSVDGFREQITGEVRVIEVRGTLAAGIFILPWTTLANFVAWLDSKAREQKTVNVTG